MTANINSNNYNPRAIPPINRKQRTKRFQLQGILLKHNNKLDLIKTLTRSIFARLELQCLEAERQVYREKRNAEKKIRKAKAKIIKAEIERKQANSAIKIQSIIRRFIVKNTCSQKNVLKPQVLLGTSKKQTQVGTPTKAATKEKECNITVDTASKREKKARAKARKAEKKAAERAQKALNEKILLSIDTANKRNICDSLYKMCDTPAEQAYITLIYNSKLPLYLTTKCHIIPGMYSLIKSLEKGKYQVENLKIALESSNDISEIFFNKVYSQIYKQIESLYAASSLSQTYIDPKAVKCKSSQQMAVLSKSLLIKAEGCMQIFASEDLNLPLVEDKNAIGYHMQSWINEIHKGIAVFKMRIKHQVDVISSKNYSMGRETFDIFKDSTAEELFSAFGLVLFLCTTVATTEDYLNLRKEIMTKDLTEGGAFSWLLDHIASSVLEKGIIATVDMWEDVYNDAPVQSFGKKLLEITKREPLSIYDQLLDSSTFALANETLRQKLKETVQESLAIGYICELDRFTLLQHAINTMQSGELTVKETTTKEEIITYLFEKINSCTNSEINALKKTQIDRIYKKNKQIASYIEVTDKVVSTYISVYTETIDPINNNIRYISTIAGEIFDLSVNMKLAGI